MNLEQLHFVATVVVSCGLTFWVVGLISRAYIPISWEKEGQNAERINVALGEDRLSFMKKEHRFISRWTPYVIIMAVVIVTFFASTISFPSSEIGQTFATFGLVTASALLAYMFGRKSKLNTHIEVLSEQVQNRRGRLRRHCPPTA